MILRAQPVFEAIKWAGIAYLGYLAAHALRSAVRGRYAPLDGDGEEQGGVAVAFGGWRQGFLSNITNPKVLVFYLAVLPQFVAHGAGIKMDSGIMLGSHRSGAPSEPYSPAEASRGACGAHDVRRVHPEPHPPDAALPVRSWTNATTGPLRPGPGRRPGGLPPDQRERILETVMAGITRNKHLNPERRHRTYPRVIKRARNNSYRVKRPAGRAPATPDPPRSAWSTTASSHPQHDQFRLRSRLGTKRRLRRHASPVAWVLRDYANALFVCAP